MTKGYALIQSKGEYEDNYETILGVYINKEKAENLRNKYESEFNAKDDEMMKRYQSGEESEEVDEYMLWREPTSYFIKEVKIYGEIK